MPIACRMTPPFPDVSIPCSTTRILLGPGLIRPSVCEEAFLKITELRRQRVGNRGCVLLVSWEAGRGGRVERGHVHATDRKPEHLAERLGDQSGASTRLLFFAMA